jgi:dephospho-CoA kinase
MNAEVVKIAIGLTGMTASGKSTVTDMFARNGALVWKADDCVHQLLAARRDIHAALISAFGESIATDGQIDRKKLAECVFQEDKQLKKLEEILHPQVFATLKDKMSEFRQRPEPVFLAEIPLLFETQLDQWMDVTITVDASYEVCLHRFKIRTGLTELDYQSRIRRQLSRERKSSRADFVIDNSDNLSKTQNQVNKIWNDLLQKTKTNPHLKDHQNQGSA